MSSGGILVDRSPVGRTNFMILGLGLVTCVVLSLMMKHVLKVKADDTAPPIVSEISQNYGSGLVAPSGFTVETGPDGNIGTLTLYPMLGKDQRRLVKLIGHYTWRRLGEELELDALVVVCDAGFGERVRYQVTAPQIVGRSVRELSEGERPTIRREMPPVPPKPDPETPPSKVPDKGAGR